MLLKHNLYLPLGSGSLAEIAAEDGKQIYKILNYLFDTYSSQIIESQILDKSMHCDSKEHYSRYACFQTEASAYLGLNVEGFNSYFSDTKYFYIYANAQKIDIKDYKQLYFISDDLYTENNGVLTFTLDNASYTLDLNSYFPDLEKFDNQDLPEPYQIKDTKTTYLLNHISFHKNIDGKYDLSNV